MADKREAIIALHCAGKSNVTIAKDLNVNRQTVWKVVKLYQERGDANDRPRSGRPRTQRTQGRVKTVREKIRRNQGRSLRKLAKETNMGATTMRELVHEDLKMSSFRLEQKQFLSDLQKKKRLDRCKVLLNELKQGMDIGEIVFSDEKLFTVEASFNKKNDLVIGKSAKDIPAHVKVVTRRQKPQSVMVWAAVSRTWKSPLIFVPPGVKVTAKNYIEDVLIPMSVEAKKHFKNRPWTLQQDGATSHTANITQTWCRENLPRFWNKEMWPPSSPDLNPLDFCVWGLLESKACSKPHQNLEDLKATLAKEWDRIPQETLRAATTDFRNRLEAVIAANGGHIE
jgi:transposase